MEDGSAIRTGTAAVPTGDPVRSPGPRRLDSVGICPRLRAAASWRPTRAPASEGTPEMARSGGTSTLAKSASVRVVPVGRSRAATRTVTRCSDTGVSCWTAMPAAKHSRRATVSRRFRAIHEPILRLPRWGDERFRDLGNVEAPERRDARPVAVEVAGRRGPSVDAERRARARRALRDCCGMPPR